MNIALPIVIGFILGMVVGELGSLAIRKRRRLKWWPFIVTLGLLGIALILIPAAFDRLAVLALVGVTMIYAMSTYEQVEASRQMIVANFQPLVMVKCVYSEVLAPEFGPPIRRKRYTHFVVWNAGSGAAIEMEVILVAENRTDGIEAHRETFLRAKEEYDFKPDVIHHRQGKHYIVCQFKGIDSITGVQSLDQTWLPIEVSVNKDTKEVNIVAGELEFKFGVKHEDRIQMFTGKPK